MKFLKSNLILLLFVFFSQCTPKQYSTEVKPDNELIRYAGRINFENPQAPEIYWSGTSVEIKFNGDGVSALLEDEHGDNYFNIIIDKDSLHYLKLDSAKRWYDLAKGLKEGEHTLNLVKRNEFDKGKTTFYGLKVSNGELKPLSPKSGKVIEFFGNSITAGYAIEDFSGGDSPDSTNTNNYYTYAAITARHFDADLYCTVKSGIGITVSWFPYTMPDIYDRLNPNDSTSKWDFSKVQPDLVVINLLQNDSWLVNMPDYPTFKEQFGDTAPSPEEIIDAYADFVKQIRDVYPNTPIICALGSMDATKEGSPWPGYVAKAVEKLNDDKIFLHNFPYMNKGGHPRIEDDKKMAESLINFIEKKLGW